MKTIKKIVLKNFKRFRNLELDFDNELNILVGGNEAGKSSVLQALDIVMGASRSKVETLGLETLFNQECITDFLAGARSIADLPEMFIEVYIDGLADPDFDGRNNSKGKDVCVVLNPANVKAWKAGSLKDINEETKNKLYVACSRARGNLTFVPESLLKSHKSG